MSLQSQKSTWTSVTPNKESSSLLHSCPNLQPQKLRTRLAKLWTNYCGGWRFTPRDGHFLMDNQLTSRAAETEKGSTICPADLFFSNCTCEILVGNDCSVSTCLEPTILILRKCRSAKHRVTLRRFSL